MLSFQQPAVLFALGALAIPVILHLVNRRPALRWRFPSVRFLNPSPLPRQGKRRLTDPLLLLLRLLLYAFLIGLAAGPQWQEADAAAEAEQQRTWILIDLSASMQGWNAWNEALETAEAVLDAAEPGPVGLIAFADRIEQQSEFSQDRAALRRQLRELEPTPYPADPSTAVAAAMNRIEDAGDRIHLISDFQRSAWESLSWPSARAVQLELHPVGRERRGNVAILEAQSYLRAAGELDVLVQLRNDNSNPTTSTIHLEVDGQTYSQEVEAEPWEIVPATFSIPLPQQPEGLLRIDDDAYALDNRYHLYLGLAPPLRVLSLMPPDQRAGANEEIFFIQTALETHTGSEPLRFGVDVLGSGMVQPALLANYDAVFVPGSTREADAIDFGALAEFARDGGVVLSTLDDGAVASLRALRAEGVWDLRHGGQTGRERTQGRSDSIGPLSNLSRLRETFAGDAARDLYLSHLHRYVILEDAPTDTVLLRSESGHPLLLETPVGDGHWILSALPLNTRASDLPLRNTFLPLLKELMRVAAPEGGGIDRFDLSSEIADRYPQPGLYFEDSRPAMVNIARSESDPETLDLSAIRRSQQATLAAAARADDDPARSLWHWFALAAAALFLLECALAGWLDRSRPAPQTATEGST
ncbi:MAG: BatA domain-containing protein [Opitutales bacterium]|nr:BatA domain-containing protein [Opitutales bacterium]